MLWGLGALLAAASPVCTPVPGADQLWQPSTRWVIVGEIHGTMETPDAFINLACLASATERPVTIALEYSEDWQPVIDAFLASDGGVEARAALLALPIWRSEFQDGRASVAFLKTFDRLRLMKQAGVIEAVVCADANIRSSANDDRDASMARAWKSIEAKRNGLILALVGNVHSMRKPWVRRDGTIVTAGSLMPRTRTMTINVVGNGGAAWTCQMDGCAPHANGRARTVATGIVLSDNAETPWDAIYELGVPTTAAEPAVPVRSLASQCKPTAQDC